MGEESGWKQVNGDVFRPPPYLNFFAALIGSGTQLLVLSLSVILLTIIFYHNHPLYRFVFLLVLSIFYNRRGTIVTTFIVMYALTSFVAGYVNGSYYKKHNDSKDWIWSMFYTAALFPGIISSVAFLLNIIALSYGSLAHIPIATMLIVSFISRS